MLYPLNFTLKGRLHFFPVKEDEETEQGVPNGVLCKGPSPGGWWTLETVPCPGKPQASQGWVLPAFSELGALPMPLVIYLPIICPFMTCPTLPR